MGRSLSTRNLAARAASAADAEPRLQPRRTDVVEAQGTATGQATAHGWWATVREAMRGSHHDYTAGPLGRAIVLLAIPMVLEMIMESVFAVADVFWVAHLGADAVATVGL